MSKTNMTPRDAARMVGNGLYGESPEEVRELSALAQLGAKVVQILRDTGISHFMEVEIASAVESAAIELGLLEKGKQNQ